VASPPVVAHLLERLTVGGAENLAVRLANGRTASGAPTHVYTLQPDGPLAARLSEQVILRELGIGRPSIRQAPRFLARVLAGRRRLREQLAADGVRVLQSHLPEANFWSLLATGAPSVRVIATVHNNDEFHYGDDDAAAKRRLRRLAYRLVIARCHAVVTVSDAVRASLIDELELPPASARKLVAVPNGVTVPELRPDIRSEVRRELGIEPECALLVAAGRLTAQKNFSHLVDATAQLIDGGRRVLTVIAGEGEQHDLLRDRVAQCGVGEHVRLLGVRDDVERLFQAADLFMMTSLWEGLPLVLLEAMAAGCPVVAYEIDGTRDVVENGEHGLLVPAGDVNGLSAAAASLLADSERRRTLGGQARRYVRAHHDFDLVLQRFENLYGEVLAHGDR
jgi:glycosyltransferase involved in cell wall biosynthesis